MTPRPALIFLAAAAAAILVASFLGGAAAGLVFAIAAGAFPFALMAMGAGRGGRLGRAAVPIGLALLLVEASLVGMLLLRGRALDGPWLGGLPLAAALQIYGLFLAPLAVISIGFALAFADFDVAEGDLERLRALAAERPTDEVDE